MRQAPRVALFVFAKAPRAGAVKTRLCPPLTFEQAARLQEAFVLDTLELAARVPAISLRLAVTEPGDPFLSDTARRYGVPTWLQGDGDLGARMQRALTAAFAEGFTAAAILGSDSPTLPPRLIANGLAALQRAEIVLGPARDGGYWMMAATRVIASLFENIAWGSPQVLRQSIERLRLARAQFALARLWYDVDTPADLDTLRRQIARGAPAPASRAVLAEIDAIATQG